MEFSGQYLTYEEYRLLGGTLDLMPFNILEYEVRRKIDIRTQNRLKNLDIIPQEVKMCENRMINSVDSYVKSIDSIEENGSKTSINTDGYSESYATPMQIKEIISSKQVELEDIMRSYLIGVVANNEHIMYAGV